MAVAAVMVVVMMSAMMMGQSLAATAGCTSSMISLMPCLSYSSTSAKDSSPSTKCCSALESVVKTNPRCLCDLISGDPLPLGITVNKTRAVGLPERCNVETPPASKCGEVAAEVLAPPPARSEPKTSQAPPPAEKTSQVPAQKTTPDEKSIVPTTSPVPKESKTSQTITGGGSTASLSSSALFLSVVTITTVFFV